MLDILKQMREERAITTTEFYDLIKKYEYIASKGKKINITCVMMGNQCIVDEINKKYWYLLSFEDWFKPQYYITDCECEGSSLSDFVMTINQNDTLRCEQGYEILTRNQSIDKGYLTITTTYKKVKSYKEYRSDEEYEFRGKRANELEKAGAVFNQQLADWEL